MFMRLQTNACCSTTTTDTNRYVSENIGGQGQKDKKIMDDIYYKP
jgi:hypothetical protein